jgi:dihydrofolate reductase
MIIGIVAIAKNYAIGKGGDLPWHYPADLRFFKETTIGNVVVMGSNTWRSIKAPLPDRLNIVLSRSGTTMAPPEVLKLGSRGEVLSLARYVNCDVYIVGGAKIYAEFADVIDRWIVTEVPVTAEGADTFMPADFLDGYDLDEERDLGDGLLVTILHRR